MTYSKRFLTEKINTLIDLFPAVAVIGPRQCGKSTLVKHLFPEWKYYDLERPDHYQLVSDDPIAFFARQSGPIIIDEAQQYPQIFTVLRSIIDEDRTAVGRFIVTGSSSPDIVKGLSESLVGRIATVELWPLKMSEFYQGEIPEIYNRIINSPNLNDLLDLQTERVMPELYEHWLLGGYPEARIKNQQNVLYHSLWMDAYFTDFIHRDIQRLFPRINTHNFRKMIQTLSFHSGNILNQSNISTALELSSVTIKEYLNILHDTFIWRNLTSFEKNSLKKFQKMPKGHFRDSGILHQLLKIDSVDNLLLHPAAGKSFESFVIEEIIRGFQCTMQTNIDFNFYRTKDKSEVDLIVDGPFGFIPIEVKLGTKVTQKMLSPLKSFIKDTNSNFGILVNNGSRVEVLADRTIQIPAIYL